MAGWMAGVILCIKISKKALPANYRSGGRLCQSVLEESGYFNPSKLLSVTRTLPILIGDSM